MNIQFARDALERHLREPSTSRVRIAMYTTIIEVAESTSSPKDFYLWRAALYTITTLTIILVVAAIFVDDASWVRGAAFPATVFAWFVTVAYAIAVRQSAMRDMAILAEFRFPPTKGQVALWAQLVRHDPSIRSEIEENGLEQLIRNTPRKSTESVLRRLGSGLLADGQENDGEATQEDWARFLEALHRPRGES